jgi:hypothetical protein
MPAFDDKAIFPSRSSGTAPGCTTWPTASVPKDLRRRFAKKSGAQ